MNRTAVVLGVVAGVLGVVEVVPYVRDTLAGPTRPHRGTWLIWHVLAVIAFWAHRAEGASWSLATAMMLPETWQDLYSETLSTYVLASGGGLAAVASIGAVVPSLLLYPVYFCLVNACVAGLIALRRARPGRRSDPVPTLGGHPGRPDRAVVL